jgi:hypothetical protein
MPKKLISPPEFEGQLDAWRKQMSKERPEAAGITFYSNQNGSIDIDVYFAAENMWMTQQTIAQLFDVKENTITYHIGEVYESGELEHEATTRKIRVVRKEGTRDVSRELDFYSLDMVISIGYRVNSVKATQFRKFATRILYEYIQKGFVINDVRFKQARKFDEQYYQEMLERIRDIRLSERRLYLQLTDLFALAADYDKTSELTKQFFAFVQNKLHWAITGSTAAEIISERADSKKAHMGLTSWSHMPDGKIYKTDVTIAKNYLYDNELHKLRLAVNAFLDLAELRAERNLPTLMNDWLGFMNEYLNFNGYDILENAGKITKDSADQLALDEYEKFRPIQDLQYKSDLELLTDEAGKLKGKAK